MYVCVLCLFNVVLKIWKVFHCLYGGFTCDVTACLAIWSGIIASIILNVMQCVGAYTASLGVTEFRKDIAKFIEDRDGCSADYRNIYLINGASDGIRVSISLFTCLSVLSMCS